MYEQREKKRGITSNFSKDNHIVEMASKSNKVTTQNIVPPVKPKEKTKEE